MPTFPERFRNIVNTLSRRRKTIAPIVNNDLPEVLSVVPPITEILEHAEEAPKSFNIRLALRRILAGEPPETIFGVPQGPFLSEADLDTRYGIQADRTKTHDWHKKAMVNTLRAAACTTVDAILANTTIAQPALNANDPVTVNGLRPLRQRAETVFDQIKVITDDLVVNPRPNSNFERALLAMANYFDIPAGNALDTARMKIASRVGKETLTRSLIPEFLTLLSKVYSRDHANFPALPDVPEFALYSNIALNSCGILLNRASVTMGEMHALDVVTIVHDFDIFFHLNAESYELVKMPGRLDQYYVRIKPDQAKKIDLIRREKFTTREFDVTKTGCPALVDEPDSMLTDGDTFPDFNLIKSVVASTLEA